MSVGLKTTINWEHFEFSHGDYVRTTITGQDGATRTTDVTSQGMCLINAKYNPTVFGNVGIIFVGNKSAHC